MARSIMRRFSLFALLIFAATDAHATNVGNQSVGTNGNTAPTASTVTGYKDSAGHTTQDSTTTPHPTVETSVPGTGITQPTGGSGTQGWLSDIANSLRTMLAATFQPVSGTANSGTAMSGAPVGMGCRAATAAPTPVADGQAVFVLCGTEGKVVLLPYAVKELQIRGSAPSTDTSAHTLFAAAGSGIKNYLTALQCGNLSATTVNVTLNDTSSAPFIVPAGGGTNISFPTPLVTAANAALTFTSSSGVSTVTCNGQGFTGP